MILKKDLKIQLDEMTAKHAQSLIDAADREKKLEENTAFVCAPENLFWHGHSEAYVAMYTETDTLMKGNDAPERRLICRVPCPEGWPYKANKQKFEEKVEDLYQAMIGVAENWSENNRVVVEKVFRTAARD